METEELATLIFNRLIQKKEQLKLDYKESSSNIGYFFIDDLLPIEIAAQINTVFPKKESMVLKKSIGEFKHVAAQMDKYHPLLEKVIFAFQDERIVNVVGEICGIKSLEPDENLYAGGISLMAEGNFLNPHLDNSHDKERDKWRVLNLLYYVSPDWKEEYGGHLEIWPNGLTNDPIVIQSKFNRLAVMATHQNSWHSVSTVTFNKERCCISNYYFSNNPLKEDDAFHITSFRGRPGEKVKNMILYFDSNLRMAVRRVFKKGIRENPHLYKKNKN